MTLMTIKKQNNTKVTTTTLVANFIRKLNGRQFSVNTACTKLINGK